MENPLVFPGLLKGSGFRAVPEVSFIPRVRAAGNAKIPLHAVEESEQLLGLDGIAVLVDSESLTEETTEVVLAVFVLVGEVLLTVVCQTRRTGLVDGELTLGGSGSDLYYEDEVKLTLNGNRLTVTTELGDYVVYEVE